MRYPSNGISHSQNRAIQQACVLLPLSLSLMVGVSAHALAQTVTVRPNATGGAFDPALSTNIDGVMIGGNGTGTGGTGLGQIAIGNQAGTNITTDSTISIGNASRAAGMESVAIGQSARTTRDGSVALGSNATATGVSSTAVGKGASGAEANTAAFGASATAAGANSTAIGFSSSADFAASLGTGVGYFATVNKVGGLALGANTVVNHDNAIALGVGSASSAANTGWAGTVIGGVASTNNATATSVLSVGNTFTNLHRQVTNVADGAVNATSTDAINGSQLNQVIFGVNRLANQTPVAANNTLALALPTATGDNSLALGFGAASTHANSVALGTGSTTGDANTVSVGNATTQRRITNMANGTAATDAATVGQLNTVSDVANAANALAGNAVAYDNPAKTSVTLGGVGSTQPVTLRNVAPGTAGTDAVNLDQLNAVNGVATTAATVANQALATANALPIGFNNTANLTNPRVSAQATDALAVGFGAETTAAATRSVAIGSGSVATRANTVSIGGTGAGQQRQLTNLAAGTADTDAVNVAQLSAFASQITAASTATQAVASAVANLPVAGSTVGADPLATGSLGDRALIVGYGTSATARDATAIGSNASASAANSIAIGARSVADQENTVSVGAVGSERRITNVAAGSIAAGSTDAVNGSQLASVAQMAQSAALAASNAVVYDNPARDAVTFGTGASGSTTLRNVRAGQLAAGSTDAVNGSQLFATNQAVDVATTQSATALATSASAMTAATNAVGVADAAMAATLAKPIAGQNTSGHVSPLAAAQGADALAVGFGASAGGNRGLAVGTTARAEAADGLAIGYAARAGNMQSTAIGANAVAVADNAVAIGSGSVADQSNTVSVGTVGGERRITNVAEGVAANDAATVSQVRAVGQGGVRYDDETRTRVTLGSAGSPVGISNVARGSVSAGSTDAINGGQLYDVAQGLQGQINAAVTQTRTVANRAYGGIAAVASFQPITIGDPGKFVWALGTGGYRDKIGVSAQIGYRFVSSRTMLSAGIAAHNGDWKSPVWRAGLHGEF